MIRVVNQWSENWCEGGKKKGLPLKSEQRVQVFRRDFLNNQGDVQRHNAEGSKQIGPALFQFSYLRYSLKLPQKGLNGENQYRMSVARHAFIYIVYRTLIFPGPLSGINIKANSMLLFNEVSLDLVGSLFLSQSIEQEKLRDPAEEETKLETLLSSSCFLKLSLLAV